MEEKLFELGKDISIEKLVGRVNELMGQNEEDSDNKKWDTVFKISSLDEESKKIFLSFSELVDSLLIPAINKAQYIVSLSSLIEYGSLKISNYEAGSLFTLAYYYLDRNIDDIVKTLSIMKNENVLANIRKKTLDMDARKKMLFTIENHLFSGKIDTTKEKDVENAVNSIIKEIQEKDYYELVNE